MSSIRTSSDQDAQPDDVVAAYRAWFDNYGPGHIALVPHWAPSEKAVKAAVREALAGSGRHWNFNRDSRSRLVVIFPNPDDPRVKTGTPRRISAIYRGGSMESKRRKH